MGVIYETASTREFTGRRPHGPETELLIAVLDRAVLDYHSKQEGVRAPAEDWLFEDSDSRDIFSFSWVCEHLDLDEQALRTRINELRFSPSFSQSHRWLRRKVQSADRPPDDLVHERYRAA